MLRVSGHHLRPFGFAIATLLLLASVTAYGQSLGDVARESREKKAEVAATAPPKVITNLDLAKDAQAPEEAGASSKPQTASPGKTGAGRAAATSPMDPRAAEQWRRQILAQKRTVATLEKRLARFQASISDVDASAIARGEILNRSQALQQERVAQVQEQLEEQRAKLLDLQEEARRAGMHTQVYDP
jgi:chemotaxis protein histidine kinase CheA